jgi:hypothetical protein
MLNGPYHATALKYQTISHNCPAHCEVETFGRIDESRTNDPHSLTKREIQTQTTKLGQAVRQIASGNDC